MKIRWKILLAALTMVFGSLGISHATVLTFDDISNTTSLTPIPNGYGGLNWENMQYRYSTDNTGYTNGRVSGYYVAYNAWSNPAAASDSQFDFNGAYLTGAWNDNLNIDVIGYLNGVQKYARTVVVSASQPTWFDFNYQGIDKVYFNSYGGTHHSAYTGGSGTHFAMDDFTFNEPISGSPTPEPATILLLGVGVAGLIGSRRRRKET